MKKISMKSQNPSLKKIKSNRKIKLHFT